MWMLGTVVVVELLMHMPGFWEFELLSREYDYKRTFEASISSEPKVAPVIAAVGSSRTQYAIIPASIENRLGLQRGQVTNLGFSAGTPQDYVNLYEKYPSAFENLDVLLVEVGAYSYNWTVLISGERNDRFRRYSSLSDRFAVPDISKKIDYAAGVVLRSWDARALLRVVLKRIGSLQDPIKVTSNSGGQIDVQDLSERGADPQEAIEQPHKWDFLDYKFSEYQLEKIIKFVRTAQNSGVSVILVEPPLSPFFVDEVDEHYSTEDKMWRNRVSESVGLPIISIERSQSVCSDWRDCYFDYGHMNPIGAESFSLAIADYLTANNLITSSAVAP